MFVVSIRVSLPPSGAFGARHYSTTTIGKNMAWMYILECADGTYYVGSTRNLDQWLLQHQEGSGAQYTSRRLPVRLVYCEQYERILEAYAREKQIQNWSRAKREALIESREEMLPALAKKDFSKRKASS